MRRKRCKTCSCKIVSLRGDSTCLATLLQEIDPSRGAQSLVQTQGSGVGVREYAFSFLMYPHLQRARKEVTTSKTKIKGKKGAGEDWEESCTKLLVFTDSMAGTCYFLLQPFR